MTLKAKILSLFGRGQDTVPEFPSIYQHIRAHLADEGYGLAPGGDELPDDEYLRGEAGFGWMPGAIEGVFGHHGGDQDESLDRKVAALHAALVGLAEHPSARTRNEVRRLFLEGDARSLADPLLSRLGQNPPRDQERLYGELRALLVTSGHREVVKYCLALVAAFQDPRDAELYKVLGRHEEFTVYAAVALSKIFEDPIPAWLDLARHVEGWGRVELSAYLLESEPTPEVRAFFLREGARNKVMDEYTAGPIAMACRLHDALEEGEADEALLDGAGAILSALCSEDGPAEDMFDYPQGGQATARFLALLEPQARSLKDFVVVDTILAFAKRQHEDAALRACGWEPERREAIIESAERILAKEEWSGRAREALQGDAEDERWLALTVAKSLGSPIRDYLIGAIRKTPLESGLWFELARSSDESNIDEVLALAESLLEIESVATGPADELGLGSEFELEFCLDFILQELPRFPGKGWALIKPSLLSAVVRNRNMALRALEAWPAALITHEITERVKRGLEDPNEDIRSRCRALLQAAQS